jgi:hypothetical protein
VLTEGHPLPIAFRAIEEGDPPIAMSQETGVTSATATISDPRSKYHVKT